MLSSKRTERTFMNFMKSHGILKRTTGAVMTQHRDIADNRSLYIKTDLALQVLTTTRRPKISCFTHPVRVFLASHIIIFHGEQRFGLYVVPQYSWSQDHKIWWPEKWNFVFHMVQPNQADQTRVGKTSQRLQILILGRFQQLQLVDSNKRDGET